MSGPGTYRLGTAAITVILAEVFLWSVLLGAWWLVESELPAFRFERPEWLRAQLAGPLLLVVFLLHMGWRNRALRRFASSATLPRAVTGISGVRAVLRFLSFRIGMAFVVLALAGPQYGTRREEVKAEGVDVVVAVDVSNSMACEDLRPNRMEAARRALAQLIDRMRGDRLGMVVFAGEAFVQLPITTDRSAAKLFLNGVNTSSVGTQGTAIGEAIELAQRCFDQEAASGKAIIVITDGENHEDDAEGAARRAAEAGIIVHTVGMGTPAGGPLPIRRGGQLMGFRKDRAGNTVVSRLNEEMLRKIAAEGGGMYVRASDGTSGIQQLVDDLRTMDTAEIGSFIYTGHEDQFQYPLALGILLLVIGMSFGENNNRTSRWNAWTAA